MDKQTNENINKIISNSYKSYEDSKAGWGLISNVLSKEVIIVKQSRW